MARSARKQLADMRAMEEEDMRITMRGSGKHFYGAGATPSMGLSQFRGGRKVKYEYETESEDEMEGGQIGSLLGRLLPRSARVAPTSTDIIPFVPRVAPRSTVTDIIPLGPLGRPVATPSLSARQYGRMFQTRPSASPFVSGPTAALSRVAKRFGPAAARAATLGATLGAVGSYLGDRFGETGDAGYFDDYAGEEYGDGEFVPPTTGVFAPEGQPLIPDGLPSDLSPDELAWYLQSGNLPARYAMAASKRKRGKGKKGKGKLELEITHGDMEGGMRDMRVRNPAVDDRMKRVLESLRAMEEGVPAMEEAAPVRAPIRSQFGIENSPKVVALRAELKDLENRKKRPMTGGEQMKINKRMAEIKAQLAKLGVQTGFVDRMPKVALPDDRMGSILDRLRSSGVKPAVQRGSGKGSARAAIVRQVMKERGCSLPQASKMVKEEGLYTK
jgi:hypothetical protein